MADVLAEIARRRAALGGGGTLDAIRARKEALAGEQAGQRLADTEEAAYRSLGPLDDLGSDAPSPEAKPPFEMDWSYIPRAANWVGGLFGGPESAAEGDPGPAPSPTAPEAGTGAQAPAQAAAGRLPGMPAVDAADRGFDYAMDLVRQVNAGAIPGSEELTAAVGATPDWLFGGGDRSWNELYTDRLASERERHRAFAEENPWTSIGAQTAGGLMTGLPTMGYAMGSAVGNPGLLRRGYRGAMNFLTGHRPGRFETSGINRVPLAQRIATGTALGGLYGGAYGYGHGEGGPGDRMMSALGDGYTGATIGAATPFVGQAARPALAYLAKRRAARRGNISTRAVDPVQRALQHGTDDVTGRVEEAVPGTLWADRYGPTRELLGDRIGLLGDDADDVRKFIKTRGDQAAGKIERSLDDSFGGAPTDGPEQVGRRIYQETAAARRAAYDDAYAAPIDYASEGGRALERELWKVDPSFIRRAERMMREQGVRSRQFFVSFNDDGTIARRHRLPDVREIDYITRAINRAAKTERGKVKPGESTTDQGVIWEGQVREIRDLLKDNVNQYATALNVAAPPKVATQAMNLGVKSLSAAMTRAKLQSEIGKLKAAFPQRADMVDEYLARGMRYQFQELVDRAKDPLARNPTLSGAVAVGSTRDPVTTRTIKDLSSPVVKDKVALVIGRDKADSLFRTIDENAAATTTREAVEENIRKRRLKAEEAEKEPGVVESLFNIRPGTAVRTAVQRRRDAREDNRRKALAVVNALMEPADADRMTAVMNVRKPSERGLVGAKRAEMGVGGTALAGIPAGEDWNDETGELTALAKVLARRAAGPTGAFMP